MEFENREVYKNFDFKNKEFKNISTKNISKLNLEDKEFLKVEEDAFTEISERAFSELNFFFTKSHLQQLSNILEDEESSVNDRFVARKLLENAVAASAGIFPICQDTGTATIVCEKGKSVITGFDEKKALSKGIFNTYINKNLRYSQLIPESVFTENNSKNNLPGQIDIYSKGDKDLKFLFVAKGGGSSNKTFFFTENKSVLNHSSLLNFLRNNIKKIGTAACPPYHLGIVIGGTSPEMNLKTLKLTTAGALDHLINKDSIGFRDGEIEKEVSKITREIGMGAQYGGKHFCLDNRVVRLPRHGASVFISIGVSCYAHRNQFGYIDEKGLFLEELEKDPAKYLPEDLDDNGEGAVVDLNVSMDELRSELSKFKVSTPLLLNGDIIVARDIAHAKLKEILEKTGSLPDYIKNHPVYYAGPAKIPDGYASGSFGPTTSARMDAYVEEFQKNSGSLVMIGKGNRSQIVTDSCKDNGGFYLGAIGGAAAIVGRDCIKKVETLDFEELGMEAVFKISVENFPAFLIVDDKGNDFFHQFK